MKERPLIVNTQLVPRILDGSKTMTRRRMNPQPLDVITGEDCWVAKFQDDPPRGKMIRCQYGQVGDRLYCKETFYTDEYMQKVLYKADGREACFNYSGPWKPSIFMPRALSRITLEIVSLRAERLQEITYQDYKAEGMPALVGNWDIAFARLWDSLNPKHPWKDNDWVFVIGFRRIEVA